MTNDHRFAADLDQVANSLASATAAAVRDTGITPSNLSTVLRFINKVAQVANNAFQDVYAVLIDIQFLQDEDDVTRRLIDIRRSLALLVSRSSFREAENIGGRLRYLTEVYEQTITPIVPHLDMYSEDWNSAWSLFTDYENDIIFIMIDATSELRRMLDHLGSNPDKLELSRVSHSASERAAEFRSALAKLEMLRNRILGFSGEEGLIALVSGSEQERAAAAVTIEELRMGDTYHVQGAGAVGPGASATNVTINQTWQSLENRDTELLARELAVLRAELRARAIDTEHDLATGEVASAQLAAEKGDGPGAMTHLARVGKWTLEIATSIGTTVAAAAIKAAMGI